MQERPFQPKWNEFPPIIICTSTNDPLCTLAIQYISLLIININFYKPDSDIWTGLFCWLDEVEEDDTPKEYGI